MEIFFAMTNMYICYGWLKQPNNPLRQQGLFFYKGNRKNREMPSPG
jgi:hypothetical protein